MKTKFTIIVAVLLIMTTHLSGQTNLDDGRGKNSFPDILIAKDSVKPNTEIGFSSDKDLPTKDIVVADDQIITGSLGVGFDCVDGENFGFNTILLKENNLRIRFEDTSNPPFPANDWTLVANETAGGSQLFCHRRWNC